MHPTNEARVFASMLSLLEFGHEATRDTEQREELALVAPQETVDPGDPEARQVESQRQHFYRAFDPIYPGVDYAALPE